MEDSLTKFLFPALMLFATGLLGAMFKRNFFVMTIAAAEVAVGLAVITRLFVVDGTISTKNMNTLGD